MPTTNSDMALTQKSICRAMWFLFEALKNETKVGKNLKNWTNLQN